MIADCLPAFSFTSTASFLPLSSANLPLARGHFIPPSPGVPGLVLLTGNNSEGNEANQAHWPIIRLSEAADLGSAVSPAQKQGTWQNYATTHSAYRPRIITSAPADRRGGREPRAAGGRRRWADELGSVSEFDEEKGRERVDEWRSGPSALWFILVFLLGCYLHTCCHGDTAHSLHLCHGSHAHTHIQTTTRQANSRFCANFPKHFLLTIIEESIWAADYKSIFEGLKLSLLSWFTWFIKVPDEADISQRKRSQRQRW